jgi:hypothetical protein
MEYKAPGYIDWFTPIAPRMGLSVLRKHWDMLKLPIVISRNGLMIYVWLDGREVALTKSQRDIYSSDIEIQKLSYSISNLNPLVNASEKLNITLPKTPEGTTMDQFGNLFSFTYSDLLNFEITHIACGYQSPLFKYDGENFVKENVLRRIPPILIEGRKYIYFKDLPEIQQIDFSKNRPNYVSEKILFDEYGSWHYYWYEQNKRSLFEPV